MQQVLHYVNSTDKAKVYTGVFIPRTKPCKKPRMRFRMYHYRKEHGLTQEQVAAALNISKGLYNQLESGKRRMNETYIDALADLYGISPINLIVDAVRDDPLFQELDELYRNLSPEERRILVSSARGIAASRD